MYRLKDADKWEPIAGVPSVMTDDEYAEVSADYDKQFPDQLGSLNKRFEHVPDKKSKEVK